MTGEVGGSHGGRSAACDVEIWLVDLEACAPALAELELADPLCPAGELDRFDAARRVARMALRRLIARHFGKDLGRAAFIAGPHGKPRIEGLDGDFNVSHSGADSRGAAIICAGRVSPIGIDIERVRQVRLDERRRTLIVDAALCAGGRAPLPPDDPARLLQAWARLEAWGKADGRGIGLTLRHFGIWGTGARERGAAGASCEGEFKELLAYDLDAGPGLFAAVALPEGITPPQVRVLPADLQSMSAVASARIGAANSGVDLACGAGQKGPHRSVAQPG